MNRSALDTAKPPRMYAVVRADLGEIPRGKLMGSAGHAFLGAFWEAQKERVAAFTDSYAESAEHPKIVLAAKNAEALDSLAELCRLNSIPHHLVTDFAHTVFDKPTVTALGIGPITPKEYDVLGLRSLKLFA